MRDCLPEALKGQAFAALLRTEEAVQRWLSTLLKNINEKSTGTMPLPDTDLNQNLNFMSLSINDASALKMASGLSQNSIATGLPQSKSPNTWGK